MKKWYYVWKPGSLAYQCQLTDKEADEYRKNGFYVSPV
jgi:hypothetical protein